MQHLSLDPANSHDYNCYLYTSVTPCCCVLQSYCEKISNAINCRSECKYRRQDNLSMTLKVAKCGNFSLLYTLKWDDCHYRQHYTNDFGPLKQMLHSSQPPVCQLTPPPPTLEVAPANLQGAMIEYQWGDDLIRGLWSQESLIRGTLIPWDLLQKWP